MQSFEGLIHAPEINREGLSWLNVPAPLSLADLRGKIVLLDFWTSCCINCMHVMEALKKVEAHFPNELVVIGVHSPKFAAEKNIENVKAAIARYGITHPVIHDPNMILWSQYDVHAWPTLIFIDTQGKITGTHVGEPDPLHLLNAIRDASDFFETNGTLKSGPFVTQVITPAASRLSFPGKIKPVPGPVKRWAVADSGHHQIVLFDDAGHEMQRFGSGAKGGMDGASAHASFNSPQGLIANETTLFVADTFNHAIRTINLETGEVKTLSGNGSRGTLLLDHFEKAENVALASPWDLEIKNTYLFFANAGTHQLGAIDISQNALRVVAGNGSENIVDDRVLQAELAQPSGLALAPDGSRLYFVDAETSSLRYLNMKSATIITLVGEGLFDFGSANGTLLEARFQHCLGLALLDENRIVVADTLNNAIRLVDIAARQVTDLIDESWTCRDPVCTPFAEPAGIVADGPNRLLISDTNNHRIVECDLIKKEMHSWRI